MEIRSGMGVPVNPNYAPPSNRNRISGNGEIHYPARHLTAEPRLATATNKIKAPLGENLSSDEFQSWVEEARWREETSQ